MKIGIDISQLAYPNTGVANYLGNLVQKMMEIDTENEYVLFFSSLRGSIQNKKIRGKKYSQNVRIKEYKIPPTLLSFLWNILHVAPIEWFIGGVDLFITSDWAEPPARKAKKVSILYDLVVYRYPEEAHNKTEFHAAKFSVSANIVSNQKRKLEWVKRESEKILCISESTKKDAVDILKISPERLEVIYPGFAL